MAWSFSCPRDLYGIISGFVAPSYSLVGSLSSLVVVVVVVTQALQAARPPGVLS